MSEASGPLAIVGATLGLLGLSVVLLRDGWRAWQPARLLLAGQHRDAITAAERLERSWLRVFPSVRFSARYTVACALHLAGDLEAALAAVEPLRAQPVPKNLRYAACSIEAASLVLLDRDPARAEKLLEEALAIHRPAEDLLLLAHVKHAQGEGGAAMRLFESAGRERERRGAKLGSVILLEGKQQEAIFHTLRGLYLVKIGRGVEAQRDFDIAAHHPIANVYVARARAMLDAKAADVDPRSSLAPQVVTTEDPDGSS